MSVLDRTVTNADAAGGPFCLIVAVFLGGAGICNLARALRDRRQY
jgi:hypothetical protein